MRIKYITWIFHRQYKIMIELLIIIIIKFNTFQKPDDFVDMQSTPIVRTAHDSRVRVVNVVRSMAFLPAKN